MKHLLTSIATLILLATASAAGAQDGFKIVVNQANPVGSMSKTQLAQYFLDRATWDNGTPVAAVDLPPTSPVREAFSRELLGMSVSAVSARVKNTSTPTVATDREVLAFVRLKPGAIGYVSAGTETQGVRVLSVGRADSGGAAAQQIVEVGGAIPMPERLAGPPPEYPVVARNGHVVGDVDIEVVIDATGNVEKARVVKSIPLLDDAALYAVKRWRYKPTVLNGVAVPVKTRVRVSFNL